MPYEVKTADGVLSFVTLHDVDNALRQDLVAGEDLIREVDGFDWKPVRSVPALAQTASERAPRKKSYALRWALVGACMLAALAWAALGMFSSSG